MDIFLTDEDPEICAETLCDQHLLLQINQVSKLLTFMIAEEYTVKEDFYGTPLPELENNNIIIWTKDSETNQIWLCYYAACLMKEYGERFGFNDNAPREFGEIAACSQLMRQIARCGKEDQDIEFSFPKSWWVEDPFNCYQKRLTKELLSISCAWTNSFPPFWLKKSGIVLKREGDKIFKSLQ
tara:strand:- start:252 stop:800 length:549 start_codon:yes stop_codon:yes gene_type:complete